MSKEQKEKNKNSQENTLEPEQVSSPSNLVKQTARLETVEMADCPEVHPDFLHLSRSNRILNTKRRNIFAMMSSLIIMILLPTVIPVTFLLKRQNARDSPDSSSDIKQCIKSTASLRWSSWTQWEMCEKTCKATKQRRARNCTASDGNQSSLTESRDCNINCLDCSDVYREMKTPGVYRIKPDGSVGFDAYCDQGWTIIMKRFDGSQDFNLYWNDYKNGFGNKSAEDWLGNENLHYIVNQNNYSVRIEFTYWGSNQSYFVEYRYFRIANEGKKYELSLSDYIGNDGIRDILAPNNKQYFSTRDRYYTCNRLFIHCAQLRKGGFWYKNCGFVSPTGLYKRSPGRENDCLLWYGGSWQCLSAIVIKVKPQ